MRENAYESYTKMIDEAAQRLKLTRTQYEFAKYAERELLMSIPVEMDDGTVTLFHGVRVQHSSLFGPYIGGLRLHPGVTHEQARGIAGLMTLKCALANLPFGGACGGVAVDKSSISQSELKKLVRRYTAMVLPVIGPGSDIHSNDVGTDAAIMGWMMDTYSMMAGTAVPGIVTGKPVELLGSRGSTSATGVGAGYVLHEVMKRTKTAGARRTAVIAGFGKVGRATARMIYDDGVRIIGVSNVEGGIICQTGLNMKELISFADEGGRLADYNAPGIEHVTNDDVALCQCSILAICAPCQIIDEDIAEKLDCQVVLEAGNAQISYSADKILDRREILVIPDLLATLGGLVVSYFERVQNVQSLMWDEHEVNRMLKSIALKTFDEVWEQARMSETTLREACYTLGLQRVCEAKRIRGIFP